MIRFVMALSVSTITFLGAAATASFEDQEVASPRDVLRSKGLTLAGGRFVLEGEESAALEKWNAAQGSFAELRGARTELDELLEKEASLKELESRRNQHPISGPEATDLSG